MMHSHDTYMRAAIAQAEAAGRAGEVPVGAVLVGPDGDVLAADRNRVIAAADPTAHAEMQVLRDGARQIGNYRLIGTTLYATMEPCPMCMGAAVHARVAAVVYGAADPKWGAAGSLYDFSTDTRLNHRPQVISGICKAQCRDLIRNFFRARRNSVATPNDIQ